MNATSATFEAFILAAQPASENNAFQEQCSAILSILEIEQTTMPSDHGAISHPISAEDANLIFAIIVLLWSRQLRVALQWLARRPSSQTNAISSRIDLVSKEYPSGLDAHSTPSRSLEDGVRSHRREHEEDSQAERGNLNPSAIPDTLATRKPKSRAGRLGGSLAQAPAPNQPDSIKTQPYVFSESDVPLSSSPGANKLSVQRGVSTSTAANEDPPIPALGISTRSDSLETSLYVGSSELAKKVILSLLIIAYSHKGTGREILDPEHDTDYLHEEFKRLENVFVSSLSDEAATLASIDEKIASLWHRADPGSHLMLLLTGHGSDNAMELDGGQMIDELHLNKSFQSLHQESPKQLRVTIVFDICRENSKKVAIEMDERVALIWSCSPGQSSYALRFRAFRMPSSFFLIGLFMASLDVHQGLNTFEHCLKHRVDQLAKLNNHGNHVRECKVCIAGKTFCDNALEMDEESAQDIDLEQSRGALGELSSILNNHPHFLDLAQGVSRFFMNNKPFLRSNKLLLPPTPQRGANEPISQVPGHR